MAARDLDAGAPLPPELPPHARSAEAAWSAIAANRTTDDTPIAILTDVDGTIADPYGKISPVNAAAARGLADAGIPLHLVTGRSPASTRNISSQLTCAEPSVLLNGALVVDTRTGTVLAEQHLEHDAVAQVADATADAAPVAAVAYTKDTVFILRGGPGLEELFARDGVTPREVPHMDELRRETVVKLLLITQPDGVADLELVVSRADPDVSLIRSEPGYLEVLAPGVDKGTGCARLIAGCDYGDHTVVALGNGLNDVPMLEMAALGLVPDGASTGVLTEGRHALEAPVSESLARLCELLDVPFDAAGGLQ